MAGRKKNTALALRTDIAKVAPMGTERDFLKLIAMDLGKSVAHHIETMYPEAVKATSSTFLLSVRNHTHNELMALFDARGGAAKMLERLIERDAHRRYIRSFYRNIRKGASNGR